MNKPIPTADHLLMAMKPAGLPHVFHPMGDYCIYCGTTAMQLAQFGERICPRREPPPVTKQ
jgi:hypothetical protein